MTVYSTTSPKVIVYSVNTTSGLFSTGYILKQGTYNVTAYAFSGVIYDSKLVNVTACNDTTVILTEMGALSVQVYFNGMPAPYANLTITTPYGPKGPFTTNSTGGYYSGYALPPGSYSVTASYDGYSNTVSFQLYAGQLTSVNVSLPFLPPATHYLRFNSSQEHPQQIEDSSVPKVRCLEPFSFMLVSERLQNSVTL